ncbi:membrane peptidoglycan carboxypeptidase [Brevibacterium paucivorans]|uniref:Membrane peptidoglycan carboxypeptidase n=1 Tax=Brevibacterium paucivorans TaxID=170994 RepID=A0ABS2SJI2_9MICO|nr:membrane peptidoglycan carboxypeptidase [Brevibacterium paucivorans]
MGTRTRKDETKSLLNYPRAGYTGLAKWFPSLRLIGLGILTGFVLIIGLFTVGYLSTSIPEPNAAAAGQTSTVYYDDGKTVIGTFKVEDRKSVDIQDISPTMQQAAIAAEDQSFYENRGISVKGLSRAAVGVITDNYAGGGSTITQQYVKNYYLTNEKTLTRKLKEMFIAIKIDQEKSKDQIMADYLNTIFLGRKSYGVEVAAHNYFDTSAKELTVEQSALLAAMIQRPNLADPSENPERYEDRFRYVLNNMAENGYITKEDAKNAQLPEVKKPRSDNERLGQAGYMMDAVRSELKNQGMTDDQIDRGGMKITSTFNRDRMRDAQDAIDTLPKMKKGMHAGLTSIDPATGEVKAFYGGPKYFERMQNNSTQDTAQAGSTFKPFALVAGLEAGYRLNDSFRGSPVTFPNNGRPWTPKNYGGASYGSVTLLKATQSSINTAYAQLNINVGPDKTRDVAVRAGLPKDTPGLDDNASNVLGTASPTTLQMASAFSTFAAEGVYRSPHFVREAVDSSGESLYKPDTKGERKFEQDIMAETTYALSQVVQSGSGSYAQNLGRPAAGKTGTSSDAYSAWFVGYTPELATAVSLFREDEEGRWQKIGSYGGRGEVTGGSFPIQVWTRYMSDALEGQPKSKFPKRPDLPDKDRPKNKSGVSKSSSNSGSSGSSNKKRYSKKDKKDDEGKKDEEKKPEEDQKESDDSDDSGDSGDSGDKGKDSGSESGDFGGSEDSGSEKKKSGGDKSSGEKGNTPPKKKEPKKSKSKSSSSSKSKSSKSSTSSE